MTYLSNAVRRAIDRGLQQGFQLGFQQGFQQEFQQGQLISVTLIWETKFGSLTRPVKTQLTKFTPEQFQNLTKTLLATQSQAEVLLWLQAQVAKSPSNQK